MKDIFNYNRLLKPICEKLTHHKHRKLISWTDDFVKRGFKYPNRSDFYYKCKICGWTFFNHKVSKEDLEYIKKWEKENDKSK